MCIIESIHKYSQAALAVLRYGHSKIPHDVVTQMIAKHSIQAIFRFDVDMVKNKLKLLLPP